MHFPNFFFYIHGEVGYVEVSRQDYEYLIIPLKSKVLRYFNTAIIVNNKSNNNDHNNSNNTDPPPVTLSLTIVTIDDGGGTSTTSRME